MHLRVITTGGTLDKVYFDQLSAYEVGAPQAEPLLRDANVGFTYTLEPLFRKDSLALTSADRTLIRSRVVAAPERLILVTHGTDTMTETGARLLGIPEKVIVLTGAMLPARTQHSDAAFNLGCAVGALQVLGPGVYIAMSGRVAPVLLMRKNRAAGRFEVGAPA